MTTKEEINQFRMLKEMPQWKILTEIIKTELKEVEEEIFEVKDNDKLYTKDDLLKKERAIMKRFISLPDTLIDEFEHWLIEEETWQEEEKQ